MLLISYYHIPVKQHLKHIYMYISRSHRKIKLNAHLLLQYGLLYMYISSIIQVASTLQHFILMSLSTTYHVKSILKIERDATLHIVPYPLTKGRDYTENI